MHNVKGGAAASKGITLLHRADFSSEHFPSNATQSKIILFKQVMEATEYTLLINSQ